MIQIKQTSSIKVKPKFDYEQQEDGSYKFTVLHETDSLSLADLQYRANALENMKTTMTANIDRIQDDLDEVQEELGALYVAIEKAAKG